QRDRHFADTRGDVGALEAARTIPEEDRERRGSGRHHVEVAVLVQVSRGEANQGRGRLVDVRCERAITSAEQEREGRGRSSVGPAARHQIESPIVVEVAAGDRGGPGARIERPEWRANEGCGGRGRRKSGGDGDEERAPQPPPRG